MYNQSYILTNISLIIRFIKIILGTKWQANIISGVMVSKPTPRVADYGFAPRSFQSNGYEIVIYLFFWLFH